MLRKIIILIGLIILVFLACNWTQELGSINRQLHWASAIRHGIHQRYGIWSIFIAASTALIASIVKNN